MAFHNVRFPTAIDYGSGGGPSFNNNVIELASGLEERIQRWSGSGKRRFNASYTVRSHTDLYTVLKFYIARGGSAASFRYKDWNDYASTSDGKTHLGQSIDDEDQSIAAGDGSTTRFQLVKEYTNGGVTVTRNIELPVDGTVVVAVDGVAQTIDTDVSVNTSTGILTFATAPALNAAITAGFEFDTPVRFGTELDLALFQNIDSFDSGSVPAIPLVEVFSETADPEIGWNGGAKDFGTTGSDQTISLSDGRALKFSPSTGHNVIFPDATLIESGGPIFFIINDDGSNTLTLKYSDGTTTIGTVAAGARATLWLGVDATSGLKEWQLT